MRAPAVGLQGASPRGCRGVAEGLRGVSCVESQLQQFGARARSAGSSVRRVSESTGKRGQRLLAMRRGLAVINARRLAVSGRCAARLHPEFGRCGRELKAATVATTTTRMTSALADTQGLLETHLFSVKLLRLHFFSSQDAPRLPIAALASSIRGCTNESGLFAPSLSSRLWKKRRNRPFSSRVCRLLQSSVVTCCSSRRRQRSRRMRVIKGR